MKRLIIAILLLNAYTSTAQNKWKQRVDTKIDVRLDDNTHTLYAFEELEYTNNSPDTLSYIYVHLWPNAYKNDHTPFAKQQDINGATDFYFAKKQNRGYIDSLQFSINGQVVPHYSADEVPDIARIDLPGPLLPGGKIKITTPFKVKLPQVFSRSGHTDQAYYVSQWFPKPAVYDRKGWHPISYLDQGEFYSDYGSYDVSITLPTNYVVLATGNCTDEKELQWLDELAKRTLPADTLYTNSKPISSAEVKTVHYHEDAVHDFAWFADKRFVVRKDTVYSPGNNLLVTTWSAFLPKDQEAGTQLNTYLKETVKYYGKWIGPYYYKTIKAVIGDMKAGAGMEYPTITLIDQSAKSILKTATIHEAGHNWFYGMLGSNERDHAWMDEGLNTFYEQKTKHAIDHDTAKAKVGFDETLYYYEVAAIHLDQPIDQTSADFRKFNYGLDVYYKTTMMLKWLEQYIGEADFEKGMKDYFTTWQHFHPYPEDFKECMQRNTPKLIDWFFTDILTTSKKIDFTITSAKVRQNNTVITVRNNTGVKSPALIDVYDHGNKTNTVWTEPFSGVARVILPGSAWNRLKIDDIIPDAKSANDVYRRSALFHHFGVKVNPYLGLNTAEKDKLFIAPAIANNFSDGFMAGLVFHNLTLPENRFRFAFAPLYSFATNTLNGAGSIGYLWYPHGIFKEIMFQTDAKTFHDNETRYNLQSPIYASYLKVAPSLSFTFHERDPLSAVTRTLLIKEYNITNNNIDFGTDSSSKPVIKAEQNYYGMLRYRHENNRTYNPFNYTIEGQMGADFAKINVDGNLRFDYNTKNKSLYIRGYIGKFIAINNDPAVASRYYLNSSYNGMDDYLYDGTYKGRNAVNHIDAHQISSVQEGGFKIPVFNGTGRSDDWMATINLKTDLPLRKLPIKLFFDAGLIPNNNQGIKNINNRTLLYDGGVEVTLSKDIVSVYFPLIMSGDFRDYLTNTFGNKNVFARSISFTVHLQNINWLKMPSTIVSGLSR